MEHMDPKTISEQLKENDATFKNTMELIFQKYSNLDDPGPEVCLNNMTITSGNGCVPLNSARAKKELQHLRDQLNKWSPQVLENPQGEDSILNQDVTSSLSSCQMDETIGDFRCSSQKENSTSSQCSGSETSHLFAKSMSSSRSCLWDEQSQPEEEDPDLEITLNSNGSTLLEVYPGMLNQIGEAYRRQHVTDAASVVLRRYRRRRWQSSQAQHRSYTFNNDHNGTLNRMRQRASTAPNPPRDDITNYKKSILRYQGSSPHKSKMDFSPMKSISNTSLVSTACFYSPRRDDTEKSTQVENNSAYWTGQSSNSKSPRHRPVRVLDLSTPPSPGSSSARSPSPDLNQTYVVEPVFLPRSYGVSASSVSGATLSPLKMARMASLLSQRCNSENPSPSHHHSGLRRDHIYSPTASPQRALSVPLSQMRSPPKTKIISDQQITSLSYPKQASPMIRASEVCRSPYRGQRYPTPSQKNPSNQLKRQSSFSSHISPSSTISRIPSRQIDAEFMSLYHHFICRRTNPTSSCNLCKRRSVVQSPALSSTSMSALSLTPVRSQLKKRSREPEVAESLRFKRFRESCSPRRTSSGQFWVPQQQQQKVNRYVDTAVMEPNEDKYTWNRALLLHCPSPGFLRAIRQSGSGSNERGPSSRLDLQTQNYSPSWRESLRDRREGDSFHVSEGTRDRLTEKRFPYLTRPYSSRVGLTSVPARSPGRAWDRSGISASPRLSRRRLLYAPFQ